MWTDTFQSIGRPEENSMQTLQADYFTNYRNLKLSRDAKGVLIAEFHSDGGPYIMNAQGHTEFVDAFHRIGQDRANKIVIMTGAGGDFIGNVEWSSFGDVADPGVWSRIHDEGVQTLENIANIRVPMIAAVEGRVHIHSDYALLANVIVAAEGATFQDVGHFAVGVTPGDGIFTTWSYRAGAGRAEAFLLNPRPLPARGAYEWGVVAELVLNGKAVARARELADLYLKAPEVTRRNTRIHFIQPLKERAGSRLRTIARRRVIGRPGKIEASLISCQGLYRPYLFARTAATRDRCLDNSNSLTLIFTAHSASLRRLVSCIFFARAEPRNNRKRFVPSKKVNGRPDRRHAARRCN
jgi:enoyl-CoA hydratase/carnithine racemase